MRKFFLSFVAALILTSCGNLKKKDSEEDEEETVSKKDKKKKKKDLEEDDETTDEDTDSESTSTASDDDEEAPSKTIKWTKATQQEFMDACVGEAAKNVSKSRAEDYCSCAMKEAQKMFATYEELGGMTESQKAKIARNCNP